MQEMENDDDKSDTEDFNPKQHAKLLAAISRLDHKQRIKPPSRKEPSIQVSEFHLAKQQVSKKKKNAVSIKDLASVLGKGDTSQAVTLGRKLQAVQKKTKTLAKPLERIVADKMKRVEGFQEAKKVLSRWDPVVASNKVADQLVFPLVNSNVKVHETNIFTTITEPKTELEKKIHDVLKSDGYLEPEREKAEENTFPLTLEEVLAQRKEAARLRAQNSKEQIKAWRRNKIKSKKFHRVLRKEKMKQQVKEFENLKETNPEEALRRLELLEKTRAQERASLRHRNTGHWARNKAIRAKYDRESRQELSQQLSISRELTQKLRPTQDSSDSGSDEEEPPQLIPLTDGGDDVTTFVSGYRKYWETRNKALGMPSNLDDINKVGQSGDSWESASTPKTTLRESPEQPLPETPGVARKLTKKSPKLKHTTGSWTVTEVAPSYGDAKQENLKRKNKSTSEEEKVGKKMKMSVKVNDKPKSKEDEVVNKMKASDEPVPSKRKRGNKMKTAKVNGKPESSHKEGEELLQTSTFDINDLFNEVENAQQKAISRSINKLKQTSEEYHLKNDLNDMNDKEPQKKKKQLNSASRKKSAKKKVKKSCQQEENEPDINLESLVSLRHKVGEKKVMSFPLNEQAGPATEDVDEVCEIDRLASVADGTLAKPASAAPVANIDPSKFLKPRRLVSRAAELVSAGMEGLDDMEEQEIAQNQVALAEAFADDDVVDNFRKEKEDLEEASKPKEIDLSLPGWGAWGGSGVPVSQRKRKKFVFKPTQEAPRLDRNKRNVILYEGKDSGLMKHQVSYLPYPFTTVKDFEASLRAPVGSTWVPETAHRKLIAPRVLTKQGQVIAPMTEDVLFDNAE